MAPKLSREPRRSYYDLMGVETSATEQDLKRAYKRQALQLHPDKQGGNGEPFKQMKAAYDVLLDPNKRKMYDQYGEAGVKFAEGQMSPDVAMEVFMNISMDKRLGLVLAVTLFTGFLLLFPILICVKWDHPDALTYTEVLAPIWMILSTICCVCCCCVRAPSINEEDDEDTRKSVEEVQAQTLKLRLTSYAVVVLLGGFFGLLTSRLDGRIKWSYFAVIWPWMLLEFSNVVAYLFAAERLFLISGGDQETLDQGRWSKPAWLLFLFNLIRTQIIHLVFATLIALKLDGMDISWWLVFIPYWIDYLISTVQSFSKCAGVRTEAELEEMTEEQRANENTKSSIVCTFILQTISLGCVVLFCNKLVKPDAYSAYIVFLPIFVSAGCFCCCLSCGVMTMGKQEGEGEEGAGLSASAEAPAAPSYGATSSQPQQQPAAMAMPPSASSA